MFGVWFVLLCVGCGAIRYYLKELPQSSANEEKTNAFKAFQMNFLIVYFIVMGADWLQGPYVYALYESYGFSKSDIGTLFIAGFLSSGIFGTFVGGLADKYGRKLLCILFGIFYSVSCLTKLVVSFEILLIGRILSGIATSLLFSVFEAWMVTEHKKKGFTSPLLSETFSLATFGNGVVAIVAGLIASFAADNYGFVSPFMIALLLLIASVVVVNSTWVENYGDTTVDVAGTFINAINAIKNDNKIAVLGMVQSLFEAAMYTFVFMWTPALQNENTTDEVLPFGLIFACFMVCIMIGSSIFSYFIKTMTAEKILTSLLLTAAISLLLPAFVSGMGTIAVCFFVFEICCGIYFPCIGTMRGKYIPESSRAAVMNFFRVPLNFLVVIVLIKVGELANSTVFTICFLFLIAALLGVTYLSKGPQPSAIPQTQDIPTPH